MTVAELRELIANVPDDWHVVLSSDPEGNSYHGVAGHNISDYEFEPYSENYFGGEGDLSSMEDYEDAPEDFTSPPVPNCIVLWPGN